MSPGSSMGEEHKVHPPRQRPEIKRRLSLFFRLFAWLIRNTVGRYLPVRTEGLDGLPREPFILACNHLSILDPPLLCAYVMGHLRCMLSPAATKGLFVWPLSWLFRNMGAFSVDREFNRNLATVRGILRTLENNPILIFPEGGVVKRHERRVGRPGASFLASRSGAPVVPAIVVDTDLALPEGAHWIRRRPVILRFGAPIMFDERERGHPKLMTARIMAAIEALKTPDPKTKEQP